MKIRQVRVAFDIKKFGEKLKKKCNLEEYADRYEPAFFYGCYREEDIHALLDHKGIAVLIWGGSDATITPHLEKLKSLVRSRINPVYHIAPSSFIEKGLQEAGISYKRCNIFPGDESMFSPVPLGNKVYMYASHTREDRKKFYGLNHIHILQKLLPGTEFIEGFSSPLTFPYESMVEVYKECGVGVRLVPHDAGSCTVVELALMGRRCVWNGHFPGAIHYRSLEDVALAIIEELKHAGTVNEALSLQAKKAISDTSWLYTDTYISSEPAGRV
jgi:hypothetical protein